MRCAIFKFVSEKVSKACFNFEAVAGYDQAVRDRVELEGYAQFSIIETEEVFTHFSVENTIKKVEKAKNGKYKPSNGAKTNGICNSNSLSVPQSSPKRKN